MKTANRQRLGRDMVPTQAERFNSIFRAVAMCQQVAPCRSSMDRWANPRRLCFSIT